MATQLKENEEFQAALLEEERKLKQLEQEQEQVAEKVVESNGMNYDNVSQLNMPVIISDNKTNTTFDVNIEDQKTNFEPEMLDTEPDVGPGSYQNKNLTLGRFIGEPE